MNIRALILIVASIALSGCVTERSPVTGKSRAYGLSWSQELEMGRGADQQVIQQFGLYDSPKLQAYVESVGRRVLQESDLRKASTEDMYRETPFHFRVLDSPVVNALAVPGYVYVTRGLLAHVNNEAQLAVVLGHEIAHLAARHISEQALQQQLGQLGMVAGQIVGSQVLDNPQAASQLMNLSGTAYQMLTRKFSRDDEREADQLGAKYAAAEGYAITPAASFFTTLKRLGERGSATMPAWMATHPDPGEREQSMIELAKRYEPEGALRALGEDPFLEAIEGMVLGEDPRKGFVRDNIFYHPDLRFKFPVPAQWKVQNENAAVIVASPENNGVLVFKLAPGEDARDAAQQFLSSNKGLADVRSRPENVNNLNAYAITGTGQTQQGQVELLTYFIELNNRVYQFMGLAPASRFGAVQSAFARSMTGFAPLTDPQILAAQPARLAIRTVQEPAPFASFIPTSTTGLTGQELAILNQVDPGDIIPAGTKLKVPRNDSVSASR